MPSHQFPGGPPADWPSSPPSKEPRRRGRRPKPSAGTWEDDYQLAADVRDIIGSRDERGELDAEAYRDLKRLANRVLGRKLTSDEETILRRLCYGTGDAQPAQPRRARGRRLAHDDEPLRPEKASVIARHLLVWGHNLTDPMSAACSATGAKAVPASR